MGKARRGGHSVRPGFHQEALRDPGRKGSAGGVGAVAATLGSVVGRQWTRILVDAPAYRRHQEGLLAGEQDRLCARKGNIELAVGDVALAPAVEGWEPQDELAVGSFDLVADVGREDPAVVEHGTPVVLRLVRVRLLVGGGQLRHLLHGEVADRVTRQLEDAPSGGRVGLAGVLAGDHHPPATGLEQADLSVDVDSVLGVGGGAGHDPLGGRLAALDRPRVQVVPLAVEDDRRRRSRTVAVALATGGVRGRGGCVRRVVLRRLVARAAGTRQQGRKKCE